MIAKPCPVCAAPSTPDYHPFCCKHCADVDLGRWLKGNYAIPAVETDDDPESDQAGAVG